MPKAWTANDVALQLHQEGKGLNEITRITGLPRNAVKRMLGLGGIGVRRPDNPPSPKKKTRYTRPRTQCRGKPYKPPGELTPLAAALVQKYQHLVNQFGNQRIRKIAADLLRKAAITWVQEGRQGDPTDYFSTYVNYAPLRYHNWSRKRGHSA